MLLDFSIENYKSFADRATFSMEAAPKQKGLDYSLHVQKVGRKTYKGLSSAVVYGPNAAGKTAIIGALDTLKHIVLRGNARRSTCRSSPTVASPTPSPCPSESAFSREGTCSSMT